MVHQNLQNINDKKKSNVATHNYYVCNKRLWLTAGTLILLLLFFYI